MFLDRTGTPKGNGEKQIGRAYGAPRQPSTLPGSLAISQSPSSALMTPLDGLDDVHARCDPIGYELLFGETVLHLDPVLCQNSALLK